jgi:hypothetical protein
MKPKMRGKKNEIVRQHSTELFSLGIPEGLWPAITQGVTCHDRRVDASGGVAGGKQRTEDQEEESVS